MAAIKGVSQRRRAGPRSDDSWMEYAACRNSDPRMFFDREHYREALAVCEPCLVKKPCEQRGRGCGEGVWGNKAHYAKRKADT